MTCLTDWEVAPAGTVARLERIEAAARKPAERGWFAYSPCADAETNMELLAMRAALDGTP